MSLLKQIEDKGAVLEWSPISSNANLVALGTKVNVSWVRCHRPILTLCCFLRIFRIPLVQDLTITAVNWSCML